MISESRQKEYKGNEPISTHHRDSLILAMIPEVSRKNRKRKLFSEKKSTKNPFPVSTSSTMSFMKSKSKNRTWRSRQKWLSLEIIFVLFYKLKKLFIL